MEAREKEEQKMVEQVNSESRVDLDKIGSVEALVALGPETLKAELVRLGLKHGGRTEEKA